VLILLLVLLFLWIVLAAVLTGWSLWFQAYVYTEPAGGLAWRGPAAASGIMAVLLIWIVFDYRAPGRYRPLWEFSSTEDKKPFPELRIPTAAGEEVYKLRSVGGRHEYRLKGLTSGRPLPSRPARLVVREGEEKSTFEPERDAEGNFFQHRPPWWSLSQRVEPLRYIDEKGRVMVEGALGQLSTFRGGWFFGNVLFNLLLLAALFACLWLVLRFGWPLALLQAVVIWLVLLLFVLPPVLTRAEAVALSRGQPAAAAGN
jgi:hypothetical protein